MSIKPFLFDVHPLPFVFAGEHVVQLFDVQLLGNDFLVLVEKVDDGCGLYVVVYAEIRLVVGIPAVDEVEQVVFGDEFFPFVFVVLRVDGKDFEAVGLVFVEELFFDEGHLFFAVSAVGFPEEEEREGGICLVEAHPVAFHRGEFQFLCFQSDEVVLREDDFALDFLEVFFADPGGLPREVVFLGDVDERGVHAHDFVLEREVEAVADEVAEHCLAAAGAFDDVHGFLEDGVRMLEYHFVEEVVELAFEDGGADQRAVLEVGVVPIVVFVVEVGAALDFGVAVGGAFGDLLGEVGYLGREGEPGEGGERRTGVLFVEVGDVAAHLAVGGIELCGIFLPCGFVLLVGVFVECLADFARLLVLRCHEALEIQECDVFRSALDAYAVEYLHGVRGDGKMLVVADEQVEIVARREEEEVHSPCQFLLVLAEGADARGVEVRRVDGIHFSLEVVGKNQVFARHGGNGYLYVISLCKCGSRKEEQTASNE